jgi:ATP diphosphatase
MSKRRLAARNEPKPNGDRTVASTNEKRPGSRLARGAGRGRGRPSPEPGIARLLAIMARLRDPKDGCPWDLEQSFASIAKHTLEEAYEVEDAIRSGDMAALCDELGDLLLQVVFHSRMAEEAGHFDFDAVARAISDKLVRRHPGIFSDAEIETADEQLASWEVIKAQERVEKRAAAGEASSKVAALEDVPLGLPALTRAAKLLRRAEREGLSDVAPSASERKEACDSLDEQALGDALLGLVARAQSAGLDPEDALRAANARLLERARDRAR